jgi:hypothetical protein
MDSIFPSGADFVGKADRESRLGGLDNRNGGTDCSPCSVTRRCRSGLRDEAEDKQRDHENQTESRAEPEVRIQFPPAESLRTIGSSEAEPIGRFPASPAFSPDEKFVYVSNLALFLPFAGVPEPAIDSPWTLEVRHYTIVKIRAEIPPLTDRDEQ